MTWQLRRVCASRIVPVLLVALAASSFAGVEASDRGRTISPGIATIAPTLVLHIVDELGRPVDAFVRLTRTDLRGRMAMRLDRRDDLQVLAEHGVLSLRLDDGSYRVVASHGPEYAIAVSEVSIDAGRRLERTLTTSRVLDAGAYVSADLHVHTDESTDGSIDMRTRIASLRAEGLELVAITDHNRTPPPRTRVPGDPWLVPGVEVTTWSPEVGHFNVFPTHEVPEHRGRTPDGLFEEVHDDPGRLVQVNHPRLLDHIAYFGLAELRSDGTTRTGFGLGFDLLEVWNGYDLGHPDVLWSVFREWLALRTRGHAITATANSDSHDVARTRAGCPRTYVRADLERDGVEGAVDALKSGRAYVTTAPLLDVSIGDARPGDAAVVPREGIVDVHVRVQAAPDVDVERLEVWLDDRWVQSVPIRASQGSVRFDRAIRVRVEDARLLVVTVRGNRPMADRYAGRPIRPMAFTNPIRLLHPEESPRSSHGL